MQARYSAVCQGLSLLYPGSRMCNSFEAKVHNGFYAWAFNHDNACYWCWQHEKQAYVWWGGGGGKLSLRLPHSFVKSCGYAWCPRWGKPLTGMYIFRLFHQNQHILLLKMVFNVCCMNTSCVTACWKSSFVIGSDTSHLFTNDVDVYNQAKYLNNLPLQSVSSRWNLQVEELLKTCAPFYA